MTTQGALLTALTCSLALFSNARLTASRNLRLKKVTSYIADKLELRSIGSRAPSISSSSGSASEEDAASTTNSAVATKNSAQQQIRRESGVFEPERELEILVGDVVLPLNVTLATARAYYWKQGGDLIVSYRLKL